MIDPFYVVWLQIVPGNMISHFSHLSLDLQEYPAKPHSFSEPPSTGYGVSTAGKPLWGSKVKLALMEGSERFLSSKWRQIQ